MTEAREGGNTQLFSMTVLLVLYCATAVGITFQWGYNWWRGKKVRKEFEQQAIDELNPHSYDLTRNLGRIQLNVRSTMAERSTIVENSSTSLTFSDLDNLPSAHEDIIRKPDNPL